MVAIGIDGFRGSAVALRLHPCCASSAAGVTAADPSAGPPVEISIHLEGAGIGPAAFERSGIAGAHAPPAVQIQGDQCCDDARHRGSAEINRLCPIVHPGETLATVWP